MGHYLHIAWFLARVRTCIESNITQQAFPKLGRAVDVVVSIFALCSYYSIALRDDDENISSGAWGDHLSFLRRTSFWDFIHLAQDRFERLVGTPLRRDCPRGADITS